MKVTIDSRAGVTFDAFPDDTEKDIAVTALGAGHVLYRLGITDAKRMRDLIKQVKATIKEK